MVHFSRGIPLVHLFCIFLNIAQVELIQRKLRATECSLSSKSQKFSPCSFLRVANIDGNHCWLSTDLF